MNNLINLVKQYGKCTDLSYTEKTNVKNYYILELIKNYSIELRYYKNNEDFVLTLRQFKSSIGIKEDLTTKTHCHNLSGFFNYYENDYNLLIDFLSKLDLKSKLENKLVEKNTKQKVNKI